MFFSRKSKVTFTIKKGNENERLQLHVQCWWAVVAIYSIIDYCVTNQIVAVHWAKKNDGIE